MANFSLDSKATTSSQKTVGVIVPMLSREIQNETLTEDEDGDPIEGAEAEGELPLPNWLGLITDQGVFNVSINARHEHAEEMRREAMALPDGPADVGVEVIVKGNAVFYKGSKIGTRLGYDLSVVPLGQEDDARIKLMLKMRNSGDIRLTNNRNTSSNRGGSFLAHGQTFVNNFAEIDPNAPYAGQLIMMYLVYVQLQFVDVVDLNAETMDLSVKSGDKLEDDQLGRAAKAQHLIDAMQRAWNGGAAEEEVSSSSTPSRAQSAAAAAGL